MFLGKNEKERKRMKKVIKKSIANQKGFTLVEMIVVIGIIGVLVAMIVPSLVGYINKAKTSNNRVAATTIGRVATSVYAEDPTFLTEGKSRNNGLEEFLEGLKGAYVVWLDESSQQIRAMYAPNKNHLPEIEEWTGESTELVGMYPESMKVDQSNEKDEDSDKGDLPV